MSKKDNVETIYHTKEDAKRIANSIKYTKFYKKDESSKKYQEFSKKCDEVGGIIGRKEFEEIWNKEDT